MDEKTSLKMIGATAGKQRSDKDFYPTPPEVTMALLRFLDIPKDKKIWEPACGEMDMVNVFVDMGYSCVSSDIKSGCNFLETELKDCDWIITNPPFFASADFIKRCAEFNKPFALLLKSQYWHSLKRFELFKNITPEYVLPLTWRPNFEFKSREKAAPLMDCIWCVWTPPYNGQAKYIPLCRS